MDNIGFLLIIFLIFTICTVLIALFGKNVKPQSNKTDTSRQIINSLKHENSGEKIHEYIDCFEDNDEDVYIGWR